MQASLFPCCRGSEEKGGGQAHGMDSAVLVSATISLFSIPELEGVRETSWAIYSHHALASFQTNEMIWNRPELSEPECKPGTTETPSSGVSRLSSAAPSPKSPGSFHCLTLIFPSVISSVAPFGQASLSPVLEGRSVRESGATFLAV